MRRFFDVFCAALGLMILSPLFAVVAAAIKIYDHGPIFHKSQRVGLNGVMFCLFKFRTMIVNANKIGAGITNPSDTRITKIGGFLRRYKLDEFPQFINILLGDMNLVGPRPEDPRYTVLYDQHQKQILNVRPGITSPASIKFKNEAELLSGSNWEEKYIKEVMPQKLSIDIEYFRNNTFFNDIGQIIRTIIYVFRKEGME